MFITLLMFITSDVTNHSDVDNRSEVDNRSDVYRRSNVGEHNETPLLNTSKPAQHSCPHRNANAISFSDAMPHERQMALTSKSNGAVHVKP